MNISDIATLCVHCLMVKHQRLLSRSGREMAAAVYRDLERFNLVFAGKTHLFPDESQETGGKRKVSAE